MDNETDYPKGGFIADAICPYCGKKVEVNIPATPTDNEWIQFSMFCRLCGRKIKIKRYKDGSWGLYY